jgi:hypothetical protein
MNGHLLTGVAFFSRYRLPFPIRGQNAGNDGYSSMTKVVLITGASDAIGLEIAQLFMTLSCVVFMPA